MWRDVCLANRVPLAAELRRYRARLESLQHAIDTGNGAELERLFGVAAAARRNGDSAEGGASSSGRTSPRRAGSTGDHSNSAGRSSQFASNEADRHGRCPPPPLVAASVPLSGDRGQCLAAVDKLHSMHSRGFTFVEMLVVLTISAILVAMAVPSFQGIIQSSRISSSANSFLAAVDLARSEAIRRNAVVTVCRSVNPEAVNADCSNAPANGYAANDWASGWITFAKAAGNAVSTSVEAGDEIVSRQAAFPGAAGDRMIIESTDSEPCVQLARVDAQSRCRNGLVLRSPRHSGCRSHCEGTVYRVKRPRDGAPR